MSVAKAPDVEFSDDLAAATAAVTAAQNQAAVAAAQAALNAATADYRAAVTAYGSAPGPGTRATARSKFDVVLQRRATLGATVHAAAQP